jgi:alkanesulfonate monooxygenase SsuD/methylene tetrahydromethanopterin reductase-like flavin-dependent oxidoreductase (luciferase family)
MINRRVAGGVVSGGWAGRISVMTMVERLGFFTYLGGRADPVVTMREAVELFVAAEDLGYDSVWVAQHHFGPTVGRLPAPLPFLAHVAARTQRVRLGTAVVILPIEHPVRLAEDASVVDALSGGRLELGVGSGTDPSVFQALGFDAERRRELMRDGLDTLMRMLRGEPLAGGETLYPPAPGLAERVWQGVFTPQRAAQAAAAGTHVLLPKASPTGLPLIAEGQAVAARAFLEAWREPQPPRVALSRPVYVSTDRAAAERELGDEPDFQVSLLDKVVLSRQQYLDSGVFHLGSPADVTASLLADPAVPYATELIVQTGHLGPGIGNTLRSLKMFAAEVAPALGWRRALG